MRCSSYFIGSSMDLQKVIKYCKANKYQHKAINEAVHVKVFKASDIFYFKNGTIVTWNISKKISKQLAKEAAQFTDDDTKMDIQEHFFYYFDEKTIMKNHPYFNVEIITLAEDDDELRLAASFGLAQSVKLSYYQRILSDMTDKYSYLIRQLAETGSISLKRKEISQILGSIFWVKSSVNLRSEYLHVPGYFWQHSNIESIYLMVERFMDIPKRLGMLNQKLDILNEIFNILSGELQHQHAAKLEWVIIVLIVIEIIFSLLAFLK